MIVIMSANVTKREIDATVADMRGFCADVHVSVGVHRTLICGIGDERYWDIDHILALPGVERVEPVETPYQLVALGPMRQHSIVRIGDAEFGPNRFTVIGGPCAIEDQALALAIARAVKAAGAKVYRGDFTKARTGPNSFQGLGEPALEYLAAVKAETGLPFVVDVLSQEDIVLALAYGADCIRIGTRYMGVVPLLKAAGAQHQAAVMIKRGMTATIEEWLCAAEYVAQAGNLRIILCERGIRTFEKATRNTLDISAIPVVQELSHLPVIVDPSHSGGKQSLVMPLSQAAIAVGASGIMVDVHPHGDQALVDGAQAIVPDEFTKVMDQVGKIAAALDIKFSHRVPALA
jgi:3-deoxy-7-phosphoheptulonate synthase